MGSASEHTIVDFRLKRFFNEGPGASARYNLSASFCEPLTMDELLSFHPGALHDFAQVSLGYPGIHGSASLRELIAQRYPPLGASNILVTNGADEALSLVLLACLKPGDHVIVHMPGYQPFAALAQWRGCTVSAWWAREEAGWALNLEELHDLLTPTTAMIVVNFPHNPTGYVMPPSEFAQLLTMADQRGIVVLSDEVYENLELEPSARLPRAATCSPTAVSLSSLSKNFGLPGLRVGWIATANEAVLRAATRLRLHGNTYVSAPAEFLAALALSHAEAILARNRAIARTNVAAVAAVMERHHTLLAWQLPSAGVVAFPRLRGSRTALDFCADVLIHTGILLAPGPRNVPTIVALLDNYLAHQSSA